MEKLTIPAQLERLDDVIDFVKKILDEASFSEETSLQVHLAVEEIFVNIASYAYPSGDGDAEICCRLLPDPLRAEITISDSGEPFDPLAREDADTSKEALLARDGGLGILLVKKLMDKVSYRYEGGRNILTIEKRR